MSRVAGRLARDPLPAAKVPIEKAPSASESGISGAGRRHSKTESRLAAAIRRFSDAGRGISLDYMLMAVDDSRLAVAASAVAGDASAGAPEVGEGD